MKCTTDRLLLRGAGCGVRVETGRERGKRGDASVCVWGGGGGGEGTEWDT